jgi:uncharacterized membrane protein
MSRKRILLVVVLLVVFGAVYYFCGGHSTPKGQPPLLSFSSSDLTPLKTAFNASATVAARAPAQVAVRAFIVRLMSQGSEIRNREIHI